jgi:putative nucleotidyltransferase with HDIG domain
MVALPLRHGPRTFGVLVILAEEADAFDSHELTFLSELADDLAYGVGTLRMRQERTASQSAHRRGEQALRDTLTGTIEALALALEKRDPYTSGHQRRVGLLAAAIGRELGMSDDRIEGLRLGGLIHDIGKIAVPSEILNRPGRLSEAEFVLVKNHSLVGYEIVKDIAFPWPVAQMVLQHHERLDGSGYPAGARAADMILEARILAVADVVEAINSHRPYRPARGLQAALEEIRQRRGVYYDPDVVDASVKVLRSGSLSFAE